MKVVIASLVSLVALSAALALLPSTEAEEGRTPTDGPLAGLAWLVGAWRSADEAGSFDECWIRADGATMAAVSRMVHGGKTDVYELSAIEVVDGKPVLRVRHFGTGLSVWKSEAEGPQSWPLASLEGRRAVFEEPTRTFPRRIVYERLPGADGGPDRLSARLEGKQGEQERVVEFLLTRDDGR